LRLNTSRGRLLASTTLAGATLLAAFATPAAAQTKAAATEVESIVVTGSRIARKDYSSDTPIVTVSAQALENTGAVTVDTLLNQMPQFVPSVNETSNNPSNGGQANIELRGLGTPRTLVLMDGRRMTPSNSDGTVDINTVPPGLIENIEVITGGASAVYGSDAIAGVLNFRLKHHFQGVEADVQYGITDRRDGETENVSLLLGGDFDNAKGNAVIAFGYSNRGAILNGSRAFSSFSGASSTTPQGGYVAQGVNLPTQAAIDAIFARYGVAAGSVKNSTAQLRFNADGTLFATQGGATFNYKGPTGVDFSTLTVGTPGVAIGSYNTGALNDLVLPLERYNAFARVEHELVDQVTAYAQFDFTSYSSSSLLAPSPAANSPAAGGTGFLVPTTNPFIPADLKAILAARVNPNAPFVLNKRFSELGGRLADTDYTVTQMLIGLKGELSYGWTWDAYMADGREKQLETQFGNVSHAAVRNLLEAADGGASQCAGGYNPFGQHGISAACAAFISRTTKNSTQLDQRLVEATATGPVFDLPAGPLKVAVGVDYIRNTFSFIPDSVLSTSDTSSTPIPQDTAGVIGFNAQNPLHGSTDVYEIYGEALVPILKDLPLVKELNLDLGYRLSSYNTVGSVSTYKADGNWKITDMFTVRGGYARAIRAPSIGELFAPQNQNFPTIGAAAGAGKFTGDPCDVGSGFRVAGAPNAAQVRALCLAQGVPQQVIDTYTNASPQVQALTGGNPNLKQETADTYSAGIVFNPHIDMPLFERLSASVDWYHIKIEGAIGTIGAATSVQSCFNNPVGAATNPNFALGNSFCQLIRRDPSTGDIVQVVDTFANLGSYDTQGVDFQVDWGFGLGAVGLSDDYGRLAFNVIGSYTSKFDVTPIPGGNVEHHAGTVSNLIGSNYAKWKALSSVRWSWSAVELGLHWRRISAVQDFLAGGPAAPAFNYFDADARWKINDMFEVRAGVNNIGDKQPPVYTSEIQANTDPSTYDVLGRRYFVGLKARF
jgi:iron complex outermembrane receptor protein